MMCKIAVLGANGMLGHMVYYYLREKGHDPVGVCRDANSPVCDMQFGSWMLAAKNKRFKEWVVINCAGMLNNLAITPDVIREMICINASLPHQLAQVCGRLVHVSTDCVFADSCCWGYEQDPTTATDLYGRTKALGEVSYSPHLTMRQSIIGPNAHTSNGLLHWLFKQSPMAVTPLYSKVFWNGITTLELAERIAIEMEPSGLTGICHYSQDEVWAKSDLLTQIIKTFGIERKTAIDETKSGCKALKPGLAVRPFMDQLSMLREWILGHPGLYSQVYPELFA